MRRPCPAWHAQLFAVAVGACVMPAPEQPEGLAIVDATGKSTFGLGNYDACLNLSFPDVQPTASSKYAQYCLMNSGGVVFGLCLPQSCSIPDDVSNLTNGVFLYLLAQLDFLVLLDPEDATYSCGDHVQPWSEVAMGVALYLAVAAFLVVAGTCLVHRRAAYELEKEVEDATTGLLFPHVLDGPAVVSSFPTLSITAPLAAWMHTATSVAPFSTKQGDTRDGAQAGSLNGTRTSSRGSVVPPGSSSLPPGSRPLLYSFDDSDWDSGAGTGTGRDTAALQQYTYGAGAGSGGGGAQGQVAAGRRSIRRCTGLRAAVDVSWDVGMMVVRAGGTMCGRLAEAYSVSERSETSRDTSTGTNAPPYSAWMSVHLPVLDGLRVLSAAWAVAGYSALYLTVPGVINWQAVMPFGGDGSTLPFQLLTNAQLAADTSLCLTGFLSARSLLSFCMVGGKGLTVGRVLLVAARRLSRIVPVALFSVAFTAWLLPVLGKGPFWPALLAYIAPCIGVQRELATKASFGEGKGWTDVSQPAVLVLPHGPLWWTVPALTNNVWPTSGGPNQVCMPWTAYVATGTQLAVLLAPLLVLVYTRSPALGVSLALICMTASLVSAQEQVGQAGASGLFDFGAFATAIGQQLGPTDSSQYETYWDVYGAKPWARAPSFLVGCLLAFLCDWVATARHRAALARVSQGTARQVSLGIETYVSLHSGFESVGRALPLPIPATLSVLWCCLVQGMTLAMMGSVLFAPAYAFGAQRGAGSGQPWNQVVVTGYTVLSGPAWSLGLLVLLFCVFTQGPSAVIGGTGAPASLWYHSARASVNEARVRGQGTTGTAPSGGKGQGVDPSRGDGAPGMILGSAFRSTTPLLLPGSESIQAAGGPLGLVIPSPLPTTRSLSLSPSPSRTPVTQRRPSRPSLGHLAASSNSGGGVGRGATRRPSVASLPSPLPLLSGPDITLTPLLSGSWATFCFPYTLPAVYLGPAIALRLFAGNTQWNRYSPQSMAITVPACITLAFVAGAVAHVTVGQPARRLLQSVWQGLWAPRSGGGVGMGAPGTPHGRRPPPTVSHTSGSAKPGETGGGVGAGDAVTAQSPPRHMGSPVPYSLFSPGGVTSRSGAGSWLGGGPSGGGLQMRPLSRTESVASTGRASTVFSSRSGHEHGGMGPRFQSSSGASGGSVQAGST